MNTYILQFKTNVIVTDSENASNDVSASVLTGRKNMSKKKKSSSLSSPANLPTNYIKDLLKRPEKWTEEKLQDQEDDNLQGSI